MNYCDPELGSNIYDAYFPTLYRKALMRHLTIQVYWQIKDVVIAEVYGGLWVAALNKNDWKRNSAGKDD